MDLNKKSVNQQGGAMIPNQTGMQQQPQIDPQVMQITEIFSRSMEEGKQPQEVLIGLMEQEVDQNLIGQALMQLGYEEEAVIQLFEEVQNLQKPQSPSPQQITSNPEQLARAEEMQQQSSPMDMNITSIDRAKSGIEIKPENKGKFTRWAKARDMSVSEAYNKVMGNTDNYPASVVKMANFAKNAAGWNKAQDGVEIQKLSPDGRNIITEKNGMTILTDNPYDNQDAKSQLQDIETQIKLLQLQQQAAIAKAQAQHNAKKVLLNEQKEGGEFEPHFMYKGKRKIRAKDMETHLRLKEAGYTHDEPKAQYGGYIPPDPFRVNPALFSNQQIDLGKFINVGSELYNDFFSKSDKNKDNLADGVFRDMSKKKERNDRRPPRNNTYNFELDVSPANLSAIDAYYKKLEEEKKFNEATLTPYEQRLNDLPKGQYGIPYNYNNLALGSLNPMFRNEANQFYADKILQDRMREGNQTSDEMYEFINQPIVEPDRSFMDRVRNIPNTNAAAIYGAGSNAAVKIAGLANDIFDYNKFKDAKRDLRTVDTIADNVYGTVTDMNFKRGQGPDINTGIFGSEGDRTTGLYMSKEGGGVNNAGFKALPDYVQSNILSNMAYGGPKGAEAYLANKDRAIKRSMGRAQQGGETIEVDSRMLAKLIAAGADIEKL